MAKSLASLRRVKADTPPLFVAYGVHGVGKTTLASGRIPRFYSVQTEEARQAAMELDSFGDIDTFDDVLTSIEALGTEQHDYKTLVVDSIDAMEPLIWRAVCEENKWDSIETPGYGKGYIIVDDKWRTFLSYCRGLTSSGIGVVLIAHSDITKFNDPVIGEYSRYGIKLHKRAAALVQEAADVVCFCNYRVSIKKEESGFNKTTRGVGGGTRMLHFEERPGFLAKNRYQMPPDGIEYKPGKGYDAISKYFPKEGSLDKAREHFDKWAETVQPAAE